MPNTVEVGVEANTKKAEKNVKKFTKCVDGTKGAAKKAGKDFNGFTGTIDRFGSVAKKVGGIFAVAFAAKKLFDFGAAAVNASAKAEGLKTQLETLTGSAESANEIFQDLTTFSATTPFQIEGIANTTKKLLSFGFAQDEIIDKLQDLGDVAAGSGADLEELGLIFGQVRAQGKLTGERLLQLQERAIPIGPAIAETMGIAEGAVRRMVSEGKVSFEIFEQAFGSLNEEGNQFAGGMVRQSRTFAGVISTLSDNAEIFAATVGDRLLPTIKSIAIAATEALQAMTALLRPPKSNITVPETLEEVEKQLERVKRKADIAFNNLGDPNLGKEFEQQLIRFSEEIEALEAARTRLRAAEANPKDDPRVKLEEGVVAEINAIREQQKLLEEEEQVLLREARGEQEESDLEALREFEFRKIEITREAELTKAKLIQDEQRRISEIAKINAKADLKRRQTEVKQEVAHEKQLTTIKRQEVNARFDIIRAGFELAGALAEDGSKTQIRIQKGAAVASSIIAGYQAVAQALATPPGPPFTFALAATVGAAAALRTAAITSTFIKSFQQGGIVPGTSFSGDRVPALVNSGELILNRAQQGVIARDVQNSSDNRPIVIQIDGREIARAVRDEIESGFELGLA